MGQKDSEALPVVLETLKCFFAGRMQIPLFKFVVAFLSHLVESRFEIKVSLFKVFRLIKNLDSEIIELIECGDILNPCHGPVLQLWPRAGDI